MKCVSLVLSVLAITFGARAAHAVCVGGAPDGVVATSESCDDGNAVNGDGCNNQCAIVGETSCARAVSFANLDVEDFPGSTAAWTIASDDLSGVQTQNTSNPTVALFGEDAAKGSYVVRMEVLAPITFNDDDYIGLAIGFNPGDASNINANYLVVDWKQAAQGGAQEGLRLVHVRGIVNNGTHNNHQIALRQCPNATTSCAKEIAQGRRFATTGWTDQTPVEAILTYRPDHLELRIDNILELDVRPSDFPGEFPGNVFPAGQIGFYLLSQEAVEYTNLAPFGPSVCNLTSLTPGTFPRPIGSANAVINTAGQLVEGGDQLDPASVVIKSVTGGTATIAANGNITFTPTNPAIAGSYPITVFACDNDPVIPDCDEALFTVVYAPDRDGDGVLDPLDLDDDDDGIPDRLENTLGIDPDADADSDGIPNFRDKTNRGDGQPSSCVDTAAPIGTCDAPGLEFDRDGDGVPNHLDLDSDNDGLLDVVEVFGSLPDANKNGRLDCAGGVGTNGLCNAFEVVADNGVIDFDDDNVGPDAALDSDLDGLPDFLDLDADGDGIADLIEGNSGCTDTTPADARCDGADGDGDGVVNQRDTANGHGVATYADRPDTDTDGTPDFREVDSDGDTILDLVEANSGCVDANANGVCDNQDAANDGLANDAAATRPDTDSDGRPDFRDLDSDGDGVRDSVEGTVDTDGDGRVDFRDLDSDNDGLPDVVEGSSGCADTAPRNGRCDGADANGDGLADTATNATPPDTDGDGAVDFRDLDSDNDGISDVTEGGSGCNDAAPADSVCDGPDGNGDGLVNSATLVATPDGDGDGTVDFRDLDSDDDGLPDVGEGGSGCLDADGNAVCDGPDGDGDGIADSIDQLTGFGDTTPTVPVNTDGADQPDFRDPDRDNNGTPDVADSGCVDTTPVDQRCDGDDNDDDGVVDQADGFDGFGILEDTDGDGIGDALDLDDDNDGIPDSVEAGKDTDGDGRTDDVDLDSDNDGLPDVVEAGHGAADANQDGTVDCAGGFGTNGFCDALETAPDSAVPNFTVVDTDGDGLADFRDLDSDDDGILDRYENGATCTDANLDGVCDGGDADRDGIVDSADHSDGFGAGGYENPTNTDGDATPDYRDADADGDGITDVIEGGNGSHDTDGDGKVDGGDADGDGIKDAADGNPELGGVVTVVDTDGDGTPDVQDLDSDGDTITDTDEAGDPANPVDTDDDGRPDFQDPDSDDDAAGDGTDNCRLVANSDQLDTDADGQGDACDDDDNNDGVPDGFGVQGGGCSSTGGGGTGLALVLVLGALLARRKRLAVVAAVVAAPAVAQAQSVATDYPAERFQLTSHRDGILGVEWGDVTGHLTIDVGLWLGYADDPVNVYRMADGERVASFVSRRVGGDLVVAMHLRDRVELQLGAPVIVAQGQDLGSLMGNGELTGFGLGDLRVGVKVALLKHRPIAVALMASATLPTTTTDDYGGDHNATVAPELIVSHGKGTGLRASLNLGYRIREQTRVLDLVVDDEVFGGLGVGYRWPSSFGIDTSLDVATAANDLGGAFNRNFAELRGGAGYDVARAVRLFGAGGVGIAEGFGTPDWRVLIGVRIDPRTERAAAPRILELQDPDRDGFVGEADRCPQLAENTNGFEDGDGCPDDPDPDKDGVLAGSDNCPEQAEDLDGFEDGDGCPDPDNDKDTVLDVADRCRDVPGLVSNEGCPEPDRDGDSIVDAKDNCPDEPGTLENQGCKDPQLVKITDGKLEILDIVYFELNRAAIQARSNRVLDAVATVLGAHPEIQHVRVEGHTDDQGNDAYNKRLSQKRADAVVAYLVNKGVAKARLEGVGYGEEQPKVPNDSKDNRAINRRVEFTILDKPAAVEVRPTGP